MIRRFWHTERALIHEPNLIVEAAVGGSSLPAFGVDLDTLLVTAANTSFIRLIQRLREDIVGAACQTVCLGLTGACEAVAGLVQCPAHTAVEHGADCLEMALSTAAGPLPTRLGSITIGHFMALLGVPTEHATLPPMPAEVRVRTLGRFEVLNRSGERVQTRRPQAFTLLKLLLSHRDRVIAESEILPSLWPGGPPTRPREALRVLVYDLRHALEPELAHGEQSRFISAQSGGYFIPRNAPLDLDADEFQQHATRSLSSAAAGRIDEAWAAARQALDLYGGELFEPDPPADWFAVERQRLHSLWSNVLLVSSAIRARRGDVSGAHDEAERAARADLANEGAQRQLILMLALSQGRAAASEFFVQLFHDFRTRFGIAPSRETATLVERLSHGDAIEPLLREYCPLAIEEPAAGGSS